MPMPKGASAAQKRKIRRCERKLSKYPPAVRIRRCLAAQGYGDSPMARAVRRNRQRHGGKRKYKK